LAPSYIKKEAIRIAIIPDATIAASSGANNVVILSSLYSYADLCVGVTISRHALLHGTTMVKHGKAY